MKILDQLETIDQSAHELWSDYEVRLAMGALPALIRVARAADDLEDWTTHSAFDELRNALQQLREVRK